MGGVWEFFKVTAPDLQNRLDLRWYWRHADRDYVATSLAGFDNLDACLENAREHGMKSHKVLIRDVSGGDAQRALRRLAWTWSDCLDTVGGLGGDVVTFDKRNYRN